MKVLKDVIIQMESKGRWILYNVFTQASIAISTESLALLDEINGCKEIKKIIEKNNDRKFRVWNIERFSNYDGLLADPTRRIRNPTKWPEPSELSVLELIDLFKKKYFLIDDEKKYSEIFRVKESILDYFHIGNFHQQLGQKLLMEKKIDPDKWWISQKFNSDYSDLNNNLYKAVQEYFLRDFFSKKLSKKHTVLDLGCRIGYYSKLMAKSGAKIIGIDPNERYIEIAKKNNKNNILFKVSKVGKPNSLDWLEPNSIDFVFIIDALLFYFVSPNPKEKFEINDLLSSIKRVLRPGGRFFSLEPHGLFFLRPWLGEINRPFTVITEYQHKLFNITPNIGQIVNSFVKEGFIIREMVELGINNEFSKHNLRATNFVKEFPIWWLFELQPEK